jgi:two-component system, NarL family, response regulator
MKKIEEIRILVADDHSVVREGLVALINRRRGMRVVAEAANGREAVQKFNRYHPDICLIDLRMPEMDGLEAIRSICEQDKNANIIVLTTFDDDEDIFQALRHGAKAYLLKDISRKELFDHITTVYKGTICIPSKVGAKLATHMVNSDLTKRELDVLRLLAEGESNKQIGTFLQVTEGTIKSHVNHILRKLKASARTEAAYIALKRGLIHLD